MSRPRKKINGWLEVDGQEVDEGYRCCHCGRTFMVRLGSGVERGTCFKCHDVTCGRPECNPVTSGCHPFEKKIDEFHDGKRIQIYSEEQMPARLFY